MKAIFLLVLLVIAFSAEAGDITVSTDSLTSSSSLRCQTEEISLDDHDHEIALLKIQVGALMTQLGLLIKSTQKLLVPASTCTPKSSILIRQKIPTFLRPTPTTTQVTSSYAIYTTVLATQITSAIIEIKNDKTL